MAAAPISIPALTETYQNAPKYIAQIIELHLPGIGKVGRGKQGVQSSKREGIVTFAVGGIIGAFAQRNDAHHVVRKATP